MSLEKIHVKIFGDPQLEPGPNQTNTTTRKLIINFHVYVVDYLPWGLEASEYMLLINMAATLVLILAHNHRDRDKRKKYFFIKLYPSSAEKIHVFERKFPFICLFLCP